MDVMEIDTTSADFIGYLPALHNDQHETSADIAEYEAHEAAFTDQLLGALATMAVRSKRRQADLCAALRRAGLDHNPERVTDALRRLEQDGCIEQLVPLYDGGVLMSVTSRGIEKLGAGPRWTMLDGAGTLRPGVPRHPGAGSLRI